MHKTVKARSGITLAVALATGAHVGAASADANEFDAARPLTEYRATDTYQLRASDIIGAEVNNADNEEIGEVDDLIVTREDGTLKAVLSIGGFLGIGDRLVAVPYEELLIGLDDGEADDVEVYTRLSRTELAQAPAFEYGASEAWGADVFRSRYEDDEGGDDHGAWNQIEGNWMEFKGAAKERWGELTEDDLLVVEGRRDKLIGTVQKRYDIDRDAAAAEVDAWAKAIN